MKLTWLTYRISNNLLEADEETLVIQRRKYLALKKRMYRQQKRKQGKSYKPFFTFNQIKQIEEKAQAYGLSRTGFIKAATLEKVGEKAMIPHKEDYLKIIQLLNLIYYRLEENSTEALDERLAIISYWLKELTPKIKNQ